MAETGQADDAASAEAIRDSLDHTLDAMVLERLIPVTVALAALFGAFSVYNLLDPFLGLDAPSLRVLTAANLAAITFFGLLYGLLRTGLVPVCHAHFVVGIVVAVLLAHTLYSLQRVGDLFYTHYLVVLLMGLGSVVLSSRWHFACLAAIYGGWAAVAYPIGGLDASLRFSFVLLAAGAISTACMVYRVRSHRRLVSEIAHHHATEERLSEANQRLEELSRRDPLTNLFNRRGIFERLELEIARASRGHSLALVLIDLDGFKAINDLHGHVEGDCLLLAVAEALRRQTRTSDAVCRWGGDEFLVILSDTREGDAKATAGRLIDCVRNVGLRLFPETPVTASAGLALAKVGESPLAIIERADASAYQAKRGGGDCCRPAS